MTIYEDKSPEPGHYELPLGFFWVDDAEEDGPQTVYVSFQVTDEMEEDFPGQEEEQEYGFEYAEKQREEWLADNLKTLINFGLVEKIYGHSKISSLQEFKDQRDKLSFSAYYR